MSNYALNGMTVPICQSNNVHASYWQMTSSLGHLRSHIAIDELDLYLNGTKLGEIKNRKAFGNQT